MNSYSANDFTYKTVKSKLNSFPVKSRSESNIIPLPKSPITTYRNIDETDALPVSNPNVISNIMDKIDQIFFILIFVFFSIL